MKQAVISADGDRKVYAVPDIVADNLERYCMEFCGTWLWTSPHAEKYRINGVVCFNEEDFIAYLNQYLFPEEPSVLVENLGRIGFDSPLPERYRGLPEFNF